MTCLGFVHLAMAIVCRATLVKYVNFAMYQLLVRTHPK